MKKRKKNHTTFLLLLVLLAGVSLLLYPTVSDYWNSLHSTKAIATYADEVAQLDVDRYDHLWQAAQEHNLSLAGRSNPFVLTAEQQEQYPLLLNPTGNGILGYIEIPTIQCSIPIYHGVDDSVLQIAVGHLEWTSLPTGGEGTHCVLSGHRGLPSARLFSDLDKVETGDCFMLRVLDEILTYEVDQILIVEPDDTSALLMEEGRDYCTLVTCTPYGINTHRLLVRGHRVENMAVSSVRVTADAAQIEPLLVAPIVAMPILLVLLISLLLPKKKPKHGGDYDFYS